MTKTIVTMKESKMKNELDWERLRDTLHDAGAIIDEFFVELERAHRKWFDTAEKQEEVETKARILSVALKNERNALTLLSGSLITFYDHDHKGVCRYADEIIGRAAATTYFLTNCMPAAIEKDRLYETWKALTSAKKNLPASDDFSLL